MLLIGMGLTFFLKIDFLSNSANFGNSKFFEVSILFKPLFAIFVVNLQSLYILKRKQIQSIKSELHEPYIYMNGLKVTELEDLQADIEVSFCL